jgi:hypothetical protein
MAVAILALTASPALAAQRYASSAGGGSACSSGTPCTIQTAFAQQVNGDEIILAPGDYNAASTLTVLTNASVHGVQGQAVPRIHFGPGAYLADNNTGSRASHLWLEGSTPASLQVDSNSEADQIWVHTSANGACLVYGTLIDTVCWTSSGSDVALGGGTTNNDTIVLRNVTAEATAPGGQGVEYNISGSGNTTVTAVDVIARGTTSPDITGQAPLPAHLTIDLNHSNFGSAGGGGTGLSINSTAQQTEAPLFVNTAVGDFDEVPGSPTINAGVTSPANGAFDYLGRPRVIGGATDIGAAEYDPFNGVILGTRKAKVKKHKAPVKLTCPAGTPPPCGGTLTLRYRHGSKTSVAGKTHFSIDAGATAKVKVKLKKPAFGRLADRGKLKVTASADATDGAGTSASTSGRVKLKV